MTVVVGNSLKREACVLIVKLTQNVTSIIGIKQHEYIPPHHGYVLV